MSSLNSPNGHTEAHHPVGRKKRLAIIGVGSAGVLSLLHFCTWLDHGWEIYSIHNPAKKILGIGESTNGEFVGLLEKGARFGLGQADDMARLDATLKFGSKFMGWREQSWINPLLDGNTAIHFNNFYFKDFAFERIEKYWSQKFRLLEGDVKGYVNHPDRVTVTVDDTEHEFDYVIDCMGFPESFDGYHMSDCTPVNRCQIYSIGQYDFEPFTDHIAHQHGWMFGVPLQSRKTYGYLYNDAITPKEEALKDMKLLLGADEINDREYRFQCYYAHQMQTGRVFKNGNKALFFEPLVANSIFIYIYTTRCIYDFIMGRKSQAETNAAFTKAVQEMEDVISYYYQGGAMYRSAFWDYATQHTRHRMAQRLAFHEMMAQYRAMKGNGVLYKAPVYGFKPLTWEIVDEQLGYRYMDPAAMPVFVPAI